MVKTSRIFKSSSFAKTARKAKISDDALCEAFAEIGKGQCDDLGGGVFKKRLHKNMYRGIVLGKKGSNYWIYEYLFAKKDREILRMTSWLRSENWPRAMPGLQRNN